MRDDKSRNESQSERGNDEKGESNQGRKGGEQKGQRDLDESPRDYSEKEE